jgi:Domain of unknown function (DUF4157)
MTSRVALSKNSSSAPKDGPSGDFAAKRPSSERGPSSSLDWSIGGLRVLPKLRVGSVDDPLEREADAVAEFVVSGPLSARPSGGGGEVQRKCSACQEEDEKVMRRESANGAGGTYATEAPASIHDVIRSSGRPLDAGPRRMLESRLGYEFGNVRIHTDSKAAQSAREVGALAYTVGSHVAFDEGQYMPDSTGGQKLLAHELAHVVQQGTVVAHVARQPAPPTPAKTPAPAPAGCTFACDDGVFEFLKEDLKEETFNKACPQGYPKGTTFFGQPIPGSTGAKLRSKMLEAETKAKRAMCFNGIDPNKYTLDRRISTYSTHSPAESKAVDIDYEGQPHIMHEHGEADIDKQIGPVYERIAYWGHYQKSIITKGITSVGKGTGGAGTRTWTNPETGQKEDITTGELYDKLKKESTGLTDYFGLLLKNDKELQNELEAFQIFSPEPPAAIAKLGLPTDYTPADAQTFRQRIADDYRILGGSKAQLQSFAGQTVANASNNPPAYADPSPKKDRPFEKGEVAGAMKGQSPDPAANRRPELGFLTLPKEIVVALTEVGLSWGAIDFFGESGDVMHFDCRNISDC